MLDQASRQAIVDEEQLRLLSLGYMVSGVVTALFSLMGLLYAAMGLVISIIGPTSMQAGAQPDSAPPEFVGTIFALFGGIFFLIMIALAIAKFKAASCIKKRTSRTFCMVIGGINCLGFPYGTLLGVCTFIVLGRQSVSDSFNSRPMA